MKKNAHPLNQEASAVPMRDYNTANGQLYLPGIEIPPPMRPIFPNSCTLDEYVLQLLFAGRELRQDTFEESWRLAALIHSLSKKGWPILKCEVPSPGRPKRIAAYRLDRQSPVVQAVLEELRIRFGCWGAV